MKLSVWEEGCEGNLLIKKVGGGEGEAGRNMNAYVPYLLRKDVSKYM